MNLKKIVMLTKIKLTTADGNFLQIVEIMPFNKEPDIVFWGTRAFIRVSNRLYKETFAVAAALSVNNYSDSVKMDEVSKTEKTFGDDKFLFGLPNTF